MGLPPNIATPLTKRDVCEYPQHNFNIVELHQFCFKLAGIGIGSYPILVYVSKKFIDPCYVYMLGDTVYR